MHIDAIIILCYDAHMRTTVEIDAELAQQIKVIVSESRRSMRKVINDLLRKGLSGGKDAKVQKSYSVRPFNSGSPAGIITGRFNQMYDELESERFAQQSSPAVHEGFPEYSQKKGTDQK